MRLEVRDLKRWFGPLRAVDGVSFALPPGQIWGFVGPNGAGKTTTMRILATLDEPTGGDVLLDGASIVDAPELARRSLGYMPDALPLHRDVTVFDYLDFFARAFGRVGAERRRVVQGVIDFTQLGGLRERTLDALSKGMKQRVSLARALVHDPGVLVLDEPAAGLDPRARVDLRELLKQLSAQGKTILISSHILSELAEICDGAIFLERGRIVRQGAVGELALGARSTICLRTAGSLDELHRRLLLEPGVEAVRPAGPELEVDLEVADGHSREEAAADLLARLVASGQRISELRHRRSGLEEVFLSVTQGEVQ